MSYIMLYIFKSNSAFILFFLKKTHYTEIKMHASGKEEYKGNWKDAELAGPLHSLHPLEKKSLFLKSNPGGSKWV